MCLYKRFMDEGQGCKRPSTFQMKRYSPSTCIEKYSFMLIRPPRFLYNEAIINPKRKYKNRFEHTVYSIPFPLSLYMPAHPRYVILYLHGNSSSRYEGYSQLGSIPPDVGLACFDFAGCGNRTEQDYISLGKKEAEEVDLAVRFLKDKNFKVAVWGRSMGAVSALLSLQNDLIIVDSPFSNLKAVAKEISLRAVPCLCLCFFHCIFPCVFKAVSSDVYSKTGVETEQLNVVQRINSFPQRKIMFLAARHDKMISYTHTQYLFDEYKGPKKMILFDGTHHSDRPQEVLREVYAFIEEGLFPDSSTGDDKKKKDDSELADVKSFSLLKEDKGEKQSQMRMSVKMQISSKMVEGGQTEKMQKINQSQKDQNQSDKYL